ncbi:transposase [Nocardia sp. NPDC052278]|uniref:transposase n=1 Tax=unclassified Nocardia TaxID=2637762 RepID=UPI0036CD7DB2
MPIRYGQWQTVYGLFRRWQRGGRWALILKMLQAFADAVGAIIWQISGLHHHAGPPARRWRPPRR